MKVPCEIQGCTNEGVHVHPRGQRPTGPPAVPTGTGEDWCDREDCPGNARLGRGHAQWIGGHENLIAPPQPSTPEEGGGESESDFREWVVSTWGIVPESFTWDDLRAASSAGFERGQEALRARATALDENDVVAVAAEADRIQKFYDDLSTLRADVARLREENERLRAERKSDEDLLAEIDGVRFENERVLLEKVGLERDLEAARGAFASLQSAGREVCSRAESDIALGSDMVRVPKALIKTLWDRLAPPKPGGEGKP